MSHSPNAAAVRVPREGVRVPVLDGVRGLAVLLVVAYHTLHVGETATGAAVMNGLRSPLWAGVDLFFVLSGFLITGILLDTRERPHYFRNFYVRRTLRIFPLYYGVLFAILVVAPLALTTLHRPLPEFLQVLLPRQAWLWSYMQNWLQARGAHNLPGFGHFWSLAIEEQFYLFWPFVVWTLTPKRLLRVCIGAAVGGLALRTSLMLTGVAGEWAVRHMTITRVDTLLIGAALAVAIRDDRLRARVVKAAPVALLAAITPLVAIYLFTGGADLWVATIGFTLTALTAASIIAINLERPLLDRAFLRFLGKYSYAIYVFHLPIAVAVHDKLNATFRAPSAAIPVAFAAFAVTLASSIAVAWVSWRVWESPWLSLKERFAGYKTAPNTAPASGFAGMPATESGSVSTVTT
jgi:peptidoglycan/LPS O-acetylase OafA/YrhL